MQEPWGSFLSDTSICVAQSPFEPNTLKICTSCSSVSEFSRYSNTWDDFLHGMERPMFLCLENHLTFFSIATVLDFTSYFDITKKPLPKLLNM